MVRQLLAARVHFAAPRDQTHPFKAQRLFLVQLFVPLQRQRIRQDGRTACKVTPEVTSNHAFFVIEHVASHIVSAAERGIAPLDGTPDPRTRLDLLAPQLVCTQTPVRTEGLAAPFHWTRQFDSGLAFFMDLQMVLERFGRR